MRRKITRTIRKSSNPAMIELAGWKLKDVKANALDIVFLNTREGEDDLTSAQKISYAKKRIAIGKAKSSREIVKILRPWYGKETAANLLEGVTNW